MWRDSVNCAPASPKGLRTGVSLSGPERATVGKLSECGGASFYSAFDGSTFRIVRDGEIVLGPSGNELHVYYPAAVQDGGAWHMYFGVYDAGRIKIHRAESTDGWTWTRKGVVFSADHWSWYPSLYHDGANWRCCYSVSSDGSEARIRAATASSLAGPWTDIGVILSPDDSREAGRVANCSVRYSTGVHQMLYSGRGVNDGNIWYAESTDGMNWAKSTRPVLLPSRPGDSVGVYSPSWTAAGFAYVGQASETHPKQLFTAAVPAVLGSSRTNPAIEAAHRFDVVSATYRDIGADIEVVPGGGYANAGVVFGYQDDANCWIYQHRPSGSAMVFERVAGQFTLRHSATVAATQVASLSIARDGPELVLRWNGSELTRLAYVDGGVGWHNYDSRATVTENA